MLTLSRSLTLRLFAACVFTFGFSMISSSAAHADAAIDVAISTTGATWTAVPADHEILITNPGTEPLRAVTLTATGFLAPETLSGPTVVLGNGDDVLDPGEAWSYQAKSRAGNTAGVDVTATTPSDQAVSDSASIETFPSHPFEATITPSTFRAISGDTVEWIAELINVTNSVLDYRQARVALWAGSSNTNSGSPITDYSPMTLVSRGSDEDDSWDPGETWRWTYQAVVIVDGTLLGATFEFNDLGSVTGLQQESEPIAVEPRPTSSAPGTTIAATSQPEASLPSTGADATATGIGALGIVLVGALLILATRRDRFARGHS
jgi:LPXTG-motif cell wall-anchored protein